MKYQKGELVATMAMGTGEEEQGRVVEEQLDEKTGQKYVVVDFTPKFIHDFERDRTDAAHYILKIDEVYKI